MKQAFLSKNKTGRCCLLWFFLLLFGLPDAGAQEKMVAFLDAFNHNISARKFYDKKWRDKYVRIKYERGDTTIHKLVYRQEEGTIDPDGLQILRSYLASCTGRMVSLQDILVIEYFTATETEPEPSPISFLYLLADDSLEAPGTHWVRLHRGLVGMRPERQTNGWLPDREAALSELFFPYPQLGDSFAVVAPDGRYYVWLGEYADEQVTDQVAEFSGQKKRRRKRR